MKKQKPKKHQIRFFRIYVIAIVGVTFCGSMLAYAATSKSKPAPPATSTAKPQSDTSQTTDQTVTGQSGGGKTAPTPATPDPTPTPAPAATTPKKSTPAPTPAPTPSPAPTPTPAPTGSEYATESECPGQGNVAATATVLVCLTSHARQYNDLSAIGANTSLMTAAAHKAADIQSCGFSHTACGRAFGYWITTDGYTSGCYAENIAMGQQTPLAAFTAWMNSAGHHDNIMHASYDDIGVAYLANGGNPIWVMHLGGC